jgi:predicted ribosome quality control (RQC) complex YloA/Tae2 family protein
VEVDYCPVRQVKKIPGTRPGKVTYSDYKTLYIKPADPSHLKIT